MYKPLFIFVEGNHDKLFFENILKEIMYNLEYEWDIRIIKYQERKNKKIDNLIKKCKVKENFGYFFVSDLDSHSYICFTSKKEHLQNKYEPLEKNKIIIVKEEIESWYYSGNKLDFKKNEQLNSKCSKEEFDEFITSKFDSKIDCLKEILKNFDLKLASNNNESFKYFIKKLSEIGLNTSSQCQL